jgi:hypothetical protein
VELLRNYLTGRKQQIKLQGDLSSWADIQKEVPQGSILGPLLFKIVINDIFYFIEYGTLYNYADDNTLSYVHDIANCNGLKLSWISLHTIEFEPVYQY